MAIDAFDSPHVGHSHSPASQAAPSNFVAHAIVELGTWVDEPIESGGMYGAVTTAVGPGDLVHVAYYQSAVNVRDLRYGVRENGSWLTEAVDVDGDVGNNPAMAVGADGTLHITYSDRSNFDLKHAQKSLAAGWQTETVASAGVVGEYSSIIVDQSLVSHIVYVDASNHALQYAAGEPGAWALETIDPDVVANFPRVALDSSGRLHVAYQDEQDDSIRYATRNGNGVWVVETVDMAQDTYAGLHLSLDSSDAPHLIYRRDGGLVHMSACAARP